MVFNKLDLDDIKSKIPLSTELEKKTKIIKKGKDLWCCCPFHNEKTPSCKINDNYGSFYCFGCGAKGDIFTIYQDLFNYTFLDAVRELADKAGVKIKTENNTNYENNNNILKILEISTDWFEKNLQIDQNECLSYLKKRSLLDDTIKIFRLGYSHNPKSSLYKYLKSLSFTDEEILRSNLVKKDKNNKLKDFFYKRLIFPITNMQGKVVGFGGRSLDDSNPKYINSPESDYFKKRNMLYNLNLAKNISRKKKNLLICEGYMDVISLYQNNIKSVVAPLGTSFTEEQLKLSWRFTDKPTIMFDGDEAGKRASYKAAIMSLKFLIPNKTIQFIDLPYNNDPDSFLRKNSFNDLLLLLKKPTKLIHFIFNKSINNLSLEDADQKISYDKYLDDLIESITDKKIQYFYKREFKNLFFNKLRGSYIRDESNYLPKKISSLKNKQIYSFIASAINHIKFRKQIIETIFKNFELEKREFEILTKLDKESIGEKTGSDLLAHFSEDFRQFIQANVVVDSVYRLFPYSHPKFNSELAFKEIEESTTNLNTRLSNLKKINKSLNTFEKNSSSLHWDELLKISSELEEEFRDN